MSTIQYQDRDAVIEAQREERESNEIEQLREQLKAMSKELSIKHIELETLRKTLGGSTEQD